MTLRAVIFDFDGVILDTETHVYESWRRQYAEHGEDLPLSDWISVLGMPSNTRDFHAELEQRLDRSLDRGPLRAQRVAYIESQLRGKPAMPGIVDCVTRAGKLGIQLGVASGSSHDWVDRHLKQLGLFEYFSAIVCREDTDRHKPTPAPYLEAARRLGVLPQTCAAVEDSTNGIRAARAAGMFALAVPTTMTRNENFADADFIAPSLAALPLDELIQRFG